MLFGRILLKLCNSHNLKVTNGQTSGDGVGNYTCFNRGGASAVDYLLVENPIHQKVGNLKLLPHEFDTKYTPITATFRVNTINDTIKNLLNPPKACKWDSQGSAILVL